MSARRIFVGVDWLTCTTKDDKVGLHWSMIADRRKREKALNGMDVTPWKNKWYEGVNYAGLIWAYSTRLGYIMTAQGYVAMEYWRQILPAAARVTRLDVQTTVLLPEPNIGLASEWFDRNKGKGGNRKYTIIQNSRDGQTLYVGSRHSDQFGRLYDKGVRSGEYKPGSLWRYEVQVMKPRADVLAEKMLERHEQGGDLDIPVKTYVWNWFNARGVEPVYNPGNNAFVAEVGKAVTTTDRKLTWLRSQVRPTLQRLIAEGLGKDALVALGFDEEQVEQADLLSWTSSR